jgi:hypothetical protein
MNRKSVVKKAEYGWLMVKRVRKNKKVLWVIIKLIFSTIWLYMVKWMSELILTKKGNGYITYYFYGGKMYKIFIVPTRGPSKISRILDENDNDRTEEIQKFMGPGYDFHNIPYTPSFFDCKKLVFIDNDENKTIFEQDDYLYL